MLRSLKSGAIAFNTLPEPIDYGEIKTIQLLLNPSKSPVELQQLLTLVDGIVICIDDLHIDAKAPGRLSSRCLLFLLIVVISGRKSN